MDQGAHRFRRVVGCVVAACLAAVVVQAAAEGPSQAGRQTTPRELLSKLTLSPETGQAGFEPSRFGRLIDDDRDCLLTPAEVLVREATSRAVVSRCTVTGGEWYSEFSRQTITNPAWAVVVPMVQVREAWASGANRWTKSQRQAFINDLDHRASLQVFSRSLVRDRGNDDPTDWAPAGSVTRCEYAADWVSVKWRWNMSIDKAEKTALTRMLRSECGGRRIQAPERVRGIPAPVPPTTTTSTTTAATAPPTTIRPGNPGDSKNCSDFSTWAAAQAWFNLYYPYYGDVANLDSDGDLIACETLPGAP